jgi:hypothetical protein
MKAKLKTDFEKYIISLCTKEGPKYYKTLDSIKTYFWFENQTVTPSDAYISLVIIPNPTTRIATGAKHHTGVYRFYVYTTNPLLGDKIVDQLAVLFDEITIETVGFRIETELVSTFQRGNKFEQSTHYESIAEITFHHWEG